MERYIFDSNPWGSSASLAAVGIVLNNNHTIGCGSSHRVVFVNNIGDRRVVVVCICLNAEAVLVVNDFVVRDSHTVNNIAGLDAANADSVSTSARVVGEDDVGSTVDGDAIILIDDRASRDGKISRMRDVESVSVVPKLCTSAIVVGHRADGQC